ncbi:hypothetical protein P7K49_033669 [Saguinus oedipus]|uniref:Transducer of regulated CREB activity middle domain-containing protein n=1 Tax=Saguinus oedipus TaxID=9490 RepID=A0ABQ9TSK8_SAGOE|nr:hypothetical protein P7K49_033669 [Saguinus oedipus]
MSSPPASFWPFPSIFPSADQENTTALIPATHNTGGSLPDLTNIHFPSPLPTPLDPEEPTFPSLSSSSSTGNLAANLTHLGIGGAGQAPGTAVTCFPQEPPPVAALIAEASQLLCPFPAILNLLVPPSGPGLTWALPLGSQPPPQS